MKCLINNEIVHYFLKPIAFNIYIYSTFLFIGDFLKKLKQNKILNKEQFKKFFMRL